MGARKKYCSLLGKNPSHFRGAAGTLVPELWECSSSSSSETFFPAAHLDECAGDTGSPAAVREQAVGFRHFLDPAVRAGHPG